MQVERGFEPASVVTVDLNLPASRYDPGHHATLGDVEAGIRGPLDR